LTSDHALEIHVLLERTVTPEELAALQQALELALRRRVTLSASYDRLRRPEVGTEIVLAKHRVSDQKQ
jgi:hypothetical protein